MRAEIAYVTIVQWPDGFNPADNADNIARAVRLDRFQLTQRLAKGTPIVLARIPADHAEQAERELRALGAMPLIVSESELQAFQPPMLLKRIEPAIGAPKPMFMCEPWRSESVGLLAAEIVLIIRGRIRVISTTVIDDPAPQYYTNANGAVSRVEVDASDIRRTDAQLRDVIDISLRDGRRLRIDSAKFNFDSLGKQRSYSDNENTDRLALALAKAAPRAIVDTSFGSFNCSPMLIRGAAPAHSKNGSTRRDDSPIFEFFSCWAILMYERLLGGRLIQRGP
jgi:hypothetical protein